MDPYCEKEREREVDILMSSTESVDGSIRRRDGMLNDGRFFKTTKPRRYLISFLFYVKKRNFNN